MTRHSITEQAPFTTLLTKEIDISTLSSSICEDIRTVREQANQLAFGKRIKVISKINKGRSEEKLRVGDAMVVHNHKRAKLNSRLREEPFMVKILEGSKLVVLEDSYGKQIVRSRKQFNSGRKDLQFVGSALSKSRSMKD